MWPKERSVSYQKVSSFSKRKGFRPEGMPVRAMPGERAGLASWAFAPRARAPAAARIERAK
jgi:hypothetical protein